MNLNKHLITCCLDDFKVWWPQDPAACGYETQPRSEVWAWGERGGASVFLERAVGMSSAAQSQEGTHPTHCISSSLCDAVSDAVKDTMTKSNSRKFIWAYSSRHGFH